MRPPIFKHNQVSMDATDQIWTDFSTQLWTLLIVFSQKHSEMSHICFPIMNVSPHYTLFWASRAGKLLFLFPCSWQSRNITEQIFCFLPHCNIPERRLSTGLIAFLSLMPCAHGCGVLPRGLLSIKPSSTVLYNLFILGLSVDKVGVSVVSESVHSRPLSLLMWERCFNLIRADYWRVSKRA